MHRDRKNNVLSAHSVQNTQRALVEGMCIRSPNWYQRTKPNKVAPNMPAELMKLFISFIRRIWIAINWRAFAYIMSTNAGRILISAHVHMPRSKLVNPSEGKQTGTTFQEGTRTTL